MSLAYGDEKYHIPDLQDAGSTPKGWVYAHGGWKELFPRSIQERTGNALWMTEAEEEGNRRALMWLHLLPFWEKFPPPFKIVFIDLRSLAVIADSVENSLTVFAPL